MILIYGFDYITNEQFSTDLLPISYPDALKQMTNLVVYRFNRHSVNQLLPLFDRIILVVTTINLTSEYCRQNCLTIF